MADLDYLPSLASSDVSAFDIRTVAARARNVAAINRYKTAPTYNGFKPKPNHSSYKPPPSEDTDTPAMESNAVGYYDGVTAQQRTGRTSSESSFRNELSSYASYLAEKGVSYTVPQRTVQSVSVVDDGNSDRMASNTVSAYDAVLGGYSTHTQSSVSKSGTEKESFEDHIDSANETYSILKADANTDGSVRNAAANIKNRYARYYTRSNASVTNRNQMSVREAYNSDDSDMRQAATNADANITSQYNTYASNVSKRIYDPDTGEGMASRVAAGLIHATDESGQDLPTG